MFVIPSFLTGGISFDRVKNKAELLTHFPACRVLGVYNRDHGTCTEAIESGTYQQLGHLIAETRAPISARYKYLKFRFLQRQTGVA